MNIAVLLAAGKGERMASSVIPKQFIKVNGQELFLYSLKTFASVSSIDKILLVTRKEDIEKMSIIVKNHQLCQKVMNVIAGGETRKESVTQAINYLKINEGDPHNIILIHDAARPLINEKTIKENIQACKKYDAVVTALPSSDSILLVKEKVEKELDRKQIWLAQTPQTFKLSILTKAFTNEIHEEVTDDCGVVLQIGVEPHIVMGDKINFKVTTLKDICLLEAFLKGGKDEE